MALDIGDVRTGVAVTDPMQIIASPHSVVRLPSLSATLAELKRLVAELQPVLIVAGLPLDRQGQPGPQARRVLSFVEKLRAEVDVPVVTQDERFSTASANRTLLEADMRRQQRRETVDKVAATNILRDYLDTRAAQQARQQVEAAE